MEFLNYHHLLYFAAVAREGSVLKAARSLHRSQPTLSGQIRLLEEALHEKLFEKQGRRLVLTEAGRVVLRYAEEIHLLGRELLDTVRGRPTGRMPRLAVGVVDVLPKLIAYRLLEPAIRAAGPLRLECQEDSPAVLLADLASHELDVVLSDAPVGALRVRAFSHLLGDSGTTVFGAASLASRLKGSFPKNLGGMPFLFPSEASASRRPFEQWLDERSIRPLVAGIFEDSALLKAFGQGAAGFFTGPSAIEKEIVRQYRVKIVGRIPALRERFYAITVDRKVRHPAVVALADNARRQLFR